MKLCYTKYSCSSLEKYQTQQFSLHCGNFVEMCFVRTDIDKDSILYDKFYVEIASSVTTLETKCLNFDTKPIAFESFFDTRLIRSVNFSSLSIRTPRFLTLRHSSIFILLSSIFSGIFFLKETHSVLSTTRHNLFAVSHSFTRINSLDESFRG